LTKVKICGLSSPEAVTAAVDSGADYIGFVFAKSKRQVTLTQAHDLVKNIPVQVKKVGVFVNPSMEDLEQAIEAVPLDMVQIHGDFDNSLSEKLSVPIIRAVQVASASVILEDSADYFLFDAPMAGSGKSFDWKLLDTVSIEKPFFIAGGLTTENVAQAISIFQPYAVDVSSGVETGGRKDIQKIKAFIERVKA
jgi:phosphoribosylanthranilate isomerase